MGFADRVDEGVRQRGGEDEPEGLGLTNGKVRVAVNQDEKCSSGVDLGKTIRNSLLAGLSLRCLLDKQVEMSSGQLHVRVLS